VTYTVTAENTEGKTTTSAPISYAYTIPTTTPVFPKIQGITQIPRKGAVHLNDAVHVNVTVANSTATIIRVSLRYTLVRGMPFAVDMTKTGENIWTCQIPPSPFGGNVTYTVTAENTEGKTTTSAPISYTYANAIELSSLVLFTLALLLSLPVVILLEKRWP
jgi:hypothetical protein